MECPGHWESPVCPCTIPAEHPSSPATRPCWIQTAASQHQTGTSGHHARLPSVSPFPNLINEAALEALLHPVQVQKTSAGPRGGAQGVATLTYRCTGKGSISSDLQPKVEISPYRKKRRKAGKSVCLFFYLNTICKLARQANG